ncbi:NINE protein [Plasticicumulans sp.]|uniref:TM2 domain-containing protein n=1 Tax=Plasticicumulans sp. TaxID=2307179 RepID=UPI002CA8A778|nr:NINE protein [Plasticicumulans sp.]HMV40191.1 NINE protein [Plasticicumulans sp.]HMW42862.1 NINE protein [Plasticicumulans sp.]HNM43978.1 NINE protein [Plasticicumulans sp.]
MKAGMVFCRECGNGIHSSARTCPHCGAPQKPAHSAGSKNRTTAAILALLLGAIGAHKFYLGRIAAGCLYLLFFWTYIPAIIAFVEFIVYLTMSDEMFSEKYM